MENSYKILLVDDEAGIRKIMRLFLEMEGYTIFEAVSAHQTMEIIQREKPHLVLLDVVLCGQTGFEVCEWIKKNPETKDTIVIIFTALNQEHDFKEGERVQCDFYLTKPQNPKEILKQVKRLLNEEKNSTLQ